MSDPRRRRAALDDELDAALARTVRRAGRTDLRARVMASVAQGPPSAGQPLVLWTAVAAAGVVAAMIAAHSLRGPAAPLERTANETPAATAAPVLPSPGPAAHTLAPARPARTAAIRPDRPRLANGNPPLDGATDEGAALVIDPLEQPSPPIVPLHTDALAIVPLAIDDVGSLSSEDRP